MSVIRFPARHAAAVFVMEAAEGGWLVLARGHEWLHGDLRSAFVDARWLSENLSLPVRSYVHVGGRARTPPISPRLLAAIGPVGSFWRNARAIWIARPRLPFAKDSLGRCCSAMPDVRPAM